MYYKADIFFIDAHAKGDSRNNYLDGVGHPAFLDVLAAGVGEICVVEVAFYLVIFLEVFWEAFAIFAWDAVDDAGFVLESRT